MGHTMSEFTTSSLNKKLKRELIELVQKQQEKINLLENKLKEAAGSSSSKKTENKTKKNTDRFDKEFFKHVLKVFKNNGVKELDEMSVKDYVKGLMEFPKRRVKSEIFESLSRYYEENTYTDWGQLVY